MLIITNVTDSGWYNQSLQVSKGLGLTFARCGKEFAASRLVWTTRLNPPLSSLHSARQLSIALHRFSSRLCPVGPLPPEFYVIPVRNLPLANIEMFLGLLD